jgi:hypothetical protein
MSNQQSYTINEFCVVERITRAHLYVLWGRGEGPKYYLVGSRRRITEEQRQEWHKCQEVGGGK